MLSATVRTRLLAPDRTATTASEMAERLSLTVRLNAVTPGPLPR